MPGVRQVVDEVKKVEIIFKGQGKVWPWTYLKKPYALGQVDIEAYEERIRTLTDTKNQSLMILL